MAEVKEQQKRPNSSGPSGNFVLGGFHKPRGQRRGGGGQKSPDFVYVSLIKLGYVGGGRSKSSRFLSTWFVEAP